MLEAKVEGVYTGVTPGFLVTSFTEKLHFSLQGPHWDHHSGFARGLDVRDRILFDDKTLPKGGEVRNWRQWSAISVEDLNDIANNLNIPEVKAQWLGSNLCFSGIKRFSTLPRGT